MRVLDLDLDFFLFGKAHFKDSAEERLHPDEYPPWPLDLVMTFLTKQCQLDGPRPGFIVEQHNELFYLWGEAIKAGQMASPFEVVHVDAHADLGLGDASYAYLMGELAYEPIEHRYATSAHLQGTEHPDGHCPASVRDRWGLDAQAHGV